MNAILPVIIHALAMSAAPVSVVVIGSGLLQNVIYILQLFLAGRALGQFRFRRVTFTRGRQGRRSPALRFAAWRG